MDLDFEQKVGFNLEIKTDGLVCYKEPTKGFHKGNLELYVADDHMNIELERHSCDACQRGDSNGCLNENAIIKLG